jgi:hypothetical protein
VIESDSGLRPSKLTGFAGQAWSDWIWVVSRVSPGLLTEPPKSRFYFWVIDLLDLGGKPGFSWLTDQATQK